MMRVHEREMLCAKARLDIERQTSDKFKEYGLTDGEILRVCSEVFANYIAEMAKYTIRLERHGDGATPGGSAL